MLQSRPSLVGDHFLFLLMLMCDSGVILYGEIRCQSTFKGQRVKVSIIIAVTNCWLFLLWVIQV